MSNDTNDQPTERSAAYLNWFTELESIVANKLWVTVDDLPDVDFLSAFEDGASAKQAFEDFAENNWDVPEILWNENYSEDDDDDERQDWNSSDDSTFGKTYTQEFDETTDAGPGL